MSMFESVEKSTANEDSGSQGLVEALQESPEQEISLEQLKEWKKWMDGLPNLIQAKVQKREDDPSTKKNNDMLDGLELRDLLDHDSDFEFFKGIERSLQQGALVGDGSSFCMHASHFGDIENEGFLAVSLGLRESLDHPDHEHQRGPDGSFAPVPDGNGDSVAFSVSGEKKSLFVMDVDGHGGYSDALARLASVYFILSRKFAELNLSEETDSIGRESYIEDEVLKEWDRFIADIALQDDKKPSSFIHLMTENNADGKTKNVWAGGAGMVGFMWIEKTDNSFVLHVRKMSEDTDSDDCFVVEDFGEGGVLPPLGEPFGGPTFWQFAKLKGKYPAAFKFQPIAMNVPTDTPIMAISDGLFDCEYLHETADGDAQVVYFSDKLRLLWHDFISKNVKDDETISLHDIGRSWTRELKRIATEAAQTHDAHADFVAEHLRRHPEIDIKDEIALSKLRQLWIAERMATGRGKLAEASDDITIAEIE